jgi:hypothetical protein
MADLNALYEQYLGRAPDPSGISTWSGQDEASIIAGILGSQEYANNQASQGGGGGGSPQPSNQDNSGNTNTPNSYDDQVAMLLSWGTPLNQVESLIGTRESVAQGQKAQAQEIYERTGELPSYAESVGFTPGPPSWLNPQDYTSSGYAAPYTQQQITGAVDPNNYRTMNGQLYASAKGPSDLSGGEYLIDPNTGRFKLDASGKPFGVTYAKSNNFDDWLTTPVGGLATIASVVGLPYLAGELGLFGAAEAAGAGTGLETAGAYGLPGGGAFTPAAGSGASFTIAPGASYGLAGGNYMTQGLMGPTYGELGYTGLEAGQMGPTYGELGYTGLNQGEAISAADAAAAAAAASSGLSMSDILRGLGTLKGSSLSSALSKGATSGLSNSLNNLAVGQEGMGMEIPGIVRTNQNPFLQTQATPLQTPQKTELSSIANLLRQG